MRILLPEAGLRPGAGLSLVVAGATALLFLSALALWFSLQAWPASLFPFRQPPSASLPADADIAGAATFGRDSYLVGEPVVYRLRVRYRPTVVRPELERFQGSISFLPFELIGLRQERVLLGEDTVEYRLEYRLQGVRAEPGQSYRFDPAVLYYATGDNPEDELQSLRIQPPPLPVAAYYPEDAGGIPLQPLRPAIATGTTLRTAVLVVCGLGLLGLAVMVLLWYGRRRAAAELSEEEQLWRVLHEQAAAEQPRARLLQYERVFTRLLQRHTELDPEAFWSALDPGDPQWRHWCMRARDLLEQAYRTAEPDSRADGELRVLLEEVLHPLVAEERLRREHRPGFLARLRTCPGALAVTAVLTSLATGALLLAASPQWWLSPELKRYNRLAVAPGQTAEERDNAYRALAALGDGDGDRRLRAAAYYNAGTLRAGHSLYLGNTDQRDWILPLVFSATSAEELMHGLLEGPFTEELEAVGVLARAAEELRVSRLELQEAVRLDSRAEDIRRNLELVYRWRDALLLQLVQLQQFYREQQDGEEQARSQEGIVNLLESQLPEEYDESNRRDDRGYMILERF